MASRLSRRGFLSAAPAALLANTGAPKLPSRIVDTHTHFYDPSRPQGVPWPGKHEKELYRTVLPAEYEKFARPLGVTGTIVVEASPWLEDNQWVLDLAARDPFLLGLVGHIDPGKPGFKSHIDRFRENPLFLGIRVNDEAVSNALTSPACASDFAHVAAAGLEVDILGSVSPQLVRFADRFSGLRIVVDHLPFDPSAQTALHELAQRPNVYAKVSGVLRRIGGRVPLDLAPYRPALDELWEAFGPHRLIYGSNWPVSDLIAPYPAVQRIVAEYFVAKGAAAAERYFWQNSQAAYRWKDR
jgi:predicted TIM-barrel fold metal-dependent hydrolase